MKKRLTAKEDKFCQLYVRSGNATSAYRQAFDVSENMKANTIARRGAELLSRDHIAAKMQELRDKLSMEGILSTVEVLKKWVEIATADPAEIIQMRRTCCRHCHGVDHHRQWTKIEYAMVCAEAIQKRKSPPEALGGLEFDATRDPLPSCPECFGEGIESVYVADTRKLKGNAKALYGGLKKKRDGSIEIIFRDQDRALENIARYLGMYKNTLELTGPSGGPVQTITTLAEDPIEAAKIYTKIMMGG